MKIKMELFQNRNGNRAYLKSKVLQEKEVCQPVLNLLRIKRNIPCTTMQ